MSNNGSLVKFRMKRGNWKRRGRVGCRMQGKRWMGGGALLALLMQNLTKKGLSTMYWPLSDMEGPQLFHLSINNTNSFIKIV